MDAKAFALAGGTAIFALCSASQADFTGVTLVKAPNPDPEQRTHQIFANFSNPLDTLLAVGGIPGIAPVVFNSSEPLINDDSAFAGMKEADFPGFPMTGLYDSWVSINQTTFFDGDTDYTPDFGGGVIPIEPPVIIGTHWEEDDGGWFDSDPATPEQGPSLIIAQFTLPPTASFSLSGLVNWVPAGEPPNGFISSEFEIVFIPAPAGFALFAFAGAWRSRRRRAIASSPRG